MRFYQVSLWYARPRLFEWLAPDSESRPADVRCFIQAGNEADAIEIASRCTVLEQQRRKGYTGRAVAAQPPACDRVIAEEPEREAARASRLIKSIERQPHYGVNADCFAEAEVRNAYRMRQSMTQGYWV
jgi:hypothetical protein